MLERLVTTAGSLVRLEVICTDGIMLGALVAFSASHGKLGAVVGTIASFAGAVSSVGSNADDGTLVA